MLFRMLRRSLLYHRSRVLVSLAAVSLGCALAVAVTQVALDAGDRLRRELRVFGANVAVVPSGDPDRRFSAELSVFRSRLPNTDIAAWSPLLETAALSGTTPIPVVGVSWDAAPTLFAYWRLTGRWPPPGSAGECLIGAALAKQLGLSPGSSLTLSPATHGPASQVPLGTRSITWSPPHPLTVRVSGIAGSGDAADGQCYVGLQEARALAGAPGAATLGLARLRGDTAAVEHISSAAASGLAALSAQPLRALAVTEGPLLARARWLMFASAFAVLVLAALAVLTTSIAAALDREPELALLKALGWDDRRAAALFLSEAALIGAAAGAVGALVGLFAGRALARDLFNMDLSFQPGLLGLSIVLGILVALFGAWLPSLRVYRLHPASILKAE